MELRPYAPADLDDVVGLWYRTWHATFPELVHPQSQAQWRARFRDDIAAAASVWVAAVDGRIAGFFALDEGRGYLDQFFVDPAAQGHGVGGALMAKAKALCPLGLTLHTLERNRHARAFWERHGFRLVGAGVNPVNGQRNLEYRWMPRPRHGQTF